MTGLLDRHIAAITGSGSGIGRAIALGYAREGARVVVLDINGDAAAETVSAIRQAGGQADRFVLDVAKRERCRELAALVRETIGLVSILVNNAGITRDGLALRMKKEDWSAVLETNLTGTYRAIQQVLSGMMRERWGRIINLT